MQYSDGSALLQAKGWDPSCCQWSGRSRGTGGAGVSEECRSECKVRERVQGESKLPFAGEVVGSKLL